MLENLIKPSARLLDPMERVSEILFGLIMVLTFTCSFRTPRDCGRVAAALSLSPIPSRVRGDAPEVE